MNPQPRKPPQSSQPEPSFAEAFRRRPVRAPLGLLPGRRVWTTLGWTAAVTVPLTLTASLVGNGTLDFGGSRTAAAVGEIPAGATKSPTPTGPGGSASAAPPPGPTSSPSSPPASTSPPPEVKVELPASQPPAPAPPRKSSGASGGAPPEAEAPPAAAAPPQADTAALAVSRLAARFPGRHICYRANVEGIGWQKPVCDGATAGTVGKGKRIKSLNIAVSGTKGTAANAFVHNEEWKTPWNGVADGVDNYIGGTAKDYPYMLGFVINVGDGAVCQNAHVGAYGWGGLACDKPLGQAPGNYIFGGTLDNNTWLEAVQFTV
ncbi:hypothetical protein ACIQWN_31215 [Streptomyces vinaceus]|uniref:hypothetical protein n=1 Tax=Streptomyces vinaceus TaxID=1960 RepID=UPI003800C549